MEISSVTPLDTGISRLERIALTAIFFALTFVFVFFVIARLGLVSGRYLFAVATAAVATWAFQQYVLVPLAVERR